MFGKSLRDGRQVSSLQIVLDRGLDVGKSHARLIRWRSGAGGQEEEGGQEADVHDAFEWSCAID
jgi:hypothetical protein